MVEPPSLIQQPPRQPQTTGKLSWGPIAAILFTVGVYFASQILGGLLVSVYPLIRSWNNQQTTQWLAHSNYAQFIFVAIVEAITVGLIWLFLKNRHASWHQLGLKKAQLVDIAYALSGFGVYFLTYMGVFALVQRFVHGVNTSQKQELGFNTNATGLALAAVFVSLVLLPPIVEEIVARGFLYTGLRSKLPKIIAAIITSVLFAAAHLQIGNGNGLLWVAALDTLILSFVLVYLREKTDSLWASIFLHMLKNSIAFVSLFILHLN